MADMLAQHRTIFAWHAAFVSSAVRFDPWPRPLGDALGELGRDLCPATIRMDATILIVALQ
jgi:hypothetical protein